jgi:hypothetical protein
MSRSVNQQVLDATRAADPKHVDANAGTFRSPCPPHDHAHGHRSRSRERQPVPFTRPWTCPFAWA